jgi:hypothetical protein
MDERGRDQSQSDASGEGSYQGYATPGTDAVVESSSDAIQSPTQSSEERLTTPKPVIESLGETPGDSNPALAETLRAQQGEGSTAEMLMARETAEEAGPRQSGAGVGDAMYQDQQRGVASQEYMDSDSGRPNWPDDRQREPMDYADAPRGNFPLGAGGLASLDLGLKGRVDAAVDRSSTEASYGESRSGMPPVGFNAGEDAYERREMDRPTPPSDMDLIAPEMVNLPPEDNDGE